MLVSTDANAVTSSQPTEGFSTGKPEANEGTGGQLFSPKVVINVQFNNRHHLKGHENQAGEPEWFHRVLLPFAGKSGSTDFTVITLFNI